MVCFFVLSVLICLIGFILFGWLGLILLCLFLSIVLVCSGILGWDYVFCVGDRLFVLVLLVILNIVMVIFFGSFGWLVNYLLFV